MIFMYIMMGSIMVPFLLTFWLQKYPITAAHFERMKANTYIPEIINYMVMSMKLSPNLERAVAFAAEHGRGKIAEDLRKLQWDIQMGAYRSTEEALDILAYKWGAFSDEFKHGLMLIRSSVIEVDEAKRNAILDKAVVDVLEGIRENMEEYAAEMRQPSIYLYYVGVLLPLMLIIMLPIGAAMAGLPIARTEIMILLYNILVPIGTIFFARNILSKRPPVYVPPKIPDDFPGLPKKGHIKIRNISMPAIFVAIVVGIAIYAGFTYVIDPILNPNPLLTMAWNEEAIANWFPFFQVAGLIMGVGVAASIYLLGSVSAKRKVQKDIMEMETEFQDSIYIVASRLGENRPMEEAMQYTAKFLGKVKIAEVYQKASDNIRNMGFTVEGALFDPTYGALRYVPSDSIRGSMRIVVDSIGLGVQQAARALISLSLQMRDAQKVKERITSLLSEITSMMKSIAFLIAPLVLGITSALQRIIVNALQSACGQTAAQTGSLATTNIPITLCKDPAMLQAIPSPLVFMLIMSVYVVEATLILIYFISKIEEGDNKLAFKINIAKSLPIALIFFFLSAWFASQMVNVIG
jgi:hypothetical protein